ncbi:MAG: flagellar hook-associated protein FlgL [Gammaproteobacteria bacterium]|nr:flagellar hook-associated protein FlgL [Gammaproteobacteria bacterium]
MRISTSLYYQRAVQDIQENLSQIAGLQAQVGSGKKLLRPSDAPTEAARSVDLNQAISRLDQFERNRGFANQQLGLLDATLTSVNNTLQRVRDLTIQANSSTQTDETRNIIRTEINQRLEELLDYANTRDGNGEFLFSGSKGKTQPFTLTPSGATYNGDQSPLNLQISANRAVDIGESGYEVFQKIRNGNGSFSTDVAAGNTGGGTINAGSVVDNSSFLAQDFRIVFTSATTFDVVNDTTAATVLAAQTYTDGTSISFNGIDVAVSGDVNAGDEFTIQASRNQDIFETITNLVNTLGISPFDQSGEAELQQGLQIALGDIDQAIGNILNIRTTVGTRQNSLDSADTESSSAKLVLQQTLSEVEDLDLAEAISQLTFEITSLEAVQATFSRVQNLNLFNFL